MGLLDFVFGPRRELPPKCEEDAELQEAQRGIDERKRRIRELERESQVAIMSRKHRDAGRSD